MVAATPSELFLRFSQPNTKLKKLRKSAMAAQWLQPTASRGKRDAFSLDLLSGWACPFAKDCMARVTITESGSKKLVDGPDTEFRCFSASQEVFYPTVYASRKRHFDLLRQLAHREPMAEAILAAMPKNSGIIRIHVGGDFFSPEYFEAWLLVAQARPDVLFYAYTKSLPYWIAAIDRIPENLSLTASRGGRRDDLIDKYGLKEARVVFSPEQADELGFEIDHDDSHAADRTVGSFALLIHGQQPAGSAAAAALRILDERGIDYSYGK